MYSRHTKQVIINQTEAFRLLFFCDFTCFVFGRLLKSSTQSAASVVNIQLTQLFLLELWNWQM